MVSLGMVLVLGWWGSRGGGGLKLVVVKGYWWWSRSGGGLALVGV